MKILNEIIQLLQSPVWFLAKGDFTALEELMNEMPQLHFSTVKQMIENQVEMPLLKCDAASRKKIIDFLSSLNLLEALLIRWNIELHEEWSAVYPVVSTVSPQGDAVVASSSASSLNRNSPDGPALVDLMVMLMPRNKSTLEQMAKALDAASMLAGIGQFAYTITSFYLAISFTLETKSESDILFLDSKAYPVKKRIERNELKNELKLSLNAYRAFHFNHIVDRLKSVYEKAPEFYFEISSGRIASDEIANIRQAFQNKTSPYYGDELLMLHLNKYVIIQDVLQLLSHPATKSDNIISECLDMLIYHKDALSKVACTENYWYSFFSRTPAVQLEDKKLFDQVYSLADKLTVDVEFNAIKSAVH